MSEEKKPEAVQEGQRVQVEDKHAVTSYANFCRVTGTPEELIIDFGLNAQPFGVPQEAVVITQRLVTNYYTAKRLGGHPAKMCWETQAVHLVPRAHLAKFISHKNDQVILQALQALS